MLLFPHLLQPKSTGQDVFSRVEELLGIKELHFFGLTVVKDNEHTFLDMEEKLSKYFPKDWKQDLGKSLQKRPLPLILCLKVQFYIENGRLFSERKARHLYYSDLRERVLRSECRQQEEVYFQLAGYAMQADLGDHPVDNNTELKPYFEPKQYFPPWIIAKRGINYLLCHGPKVHQEQWGMSTRDATLLFIREACRLEDVPVIFYRLHKDKKEERGTALLGLTLRGMQVYQVRTSISALLTHEVYVSGKKFEIQPDGLPSARKLVYYTGSSFRSRHLLLHLSSSHRIYRSLQPALKHLRQLEESEEKKRYRESYISDDLDLDPHGSESSPGLSRHSTSSSGIEADARQHSISTEIASMEEDSHQPVEKRLSSAASCASSSTSGFEAGSKAQAQDDGWKEEGVHPHMPCVSLAIWCVHEICFTDFFLVFFDILEVHTSVGSTSEVLKPKSQVCVDRQSHSLDDVRLLPLQAPLGTTLSPDSSHSYTFGLQDAATTRKLPANYNHFPTLDCPAKASFYGHRSSNCLSLDVLDDEQFLEFIL
uniref:FERM domain containing 1 n=1 Tax=Takifugu rubripes TaxID=31033 RepID=A0A674PLW6_TAKRU